MTFFFPQSDTGIFRKMGYFADQDGIMRRYVREADSWKSHLAQTGEFILKAAQNKKKNKVAVLGSGWLLDVPLDELSSAFQEVWLFDIKHPLPVRRKAEKYGNVRFEETDISGFAKAVYEMSKKTGNKPGFLPDPNSLKPTFTFELSSFDFVVSCNVLDQLDVILVDYLKTQCQLPLPGELQLRRMVHEAHLARLPKNKTCLIADSEELLLDAQDQVIRQRALIHASLGPQQPERTWLWHFDNAFTYHPSFKTWFRVIALEL